MRITFIIIGIVYTPFVLKTIWKTSESFAEKGIINTYKELLK